MPEFARAPIIGSPVNWCQRDRVARSYITLLLRYSIPEVPKVVSSPFTKPEYTIPVPQSVQYTNEIGSPPSTSLASSCAFITRNGYARCSPLIETPNTLSLGNR